MTTSSSPNHSVVWLQAEGGQAPGVPPLTPTPGGNAEMALAGSVLYLRLRPETPLSACDHDRAAALGHLLQGEPQDWPMVGQRCGEHGDSGTQRREALRLDLPALLPDHACRVQAGPPGLPMLIEATGPRGRVTVSVTAATNRLHRSAATLACDVARLIRWADPEVHLHL